MSENMIDVMVVFRKQRAHFEFLADGRPNGHLGQYPPSTAELLAVHSAIDELIEAANVWEVAESRYRPSSKSYSDARIAFRAALARVTPELTKDSP